MIVDTKKSIKSSRRERKAQRTRRRILEVARELFESQLYDDVKMDDISEEADLSRATLYNYFGSKEAIYFEIGVQGLHQMNQAQLMDISEDAPGLDLLLKLCEDAMRYLIGDPIMPEIIRRYLISNAQARTPSHMIVESISRGDKVEDTYSIILASFLQGMREYEKAWIKVIEKGYSDGSITHDTDMEKLSHFLFMVILGMIDRIALERIVLRKIGYTDEQIIQDTVSMIRRYLTDEHGAGRLPLT